jgi:hypothetical protein
VKQYREFHFEGYDWDETAREVRLRYSLDQAVHFTDTVRFEFELDDYHRAGLDRVLRSLWLMAGVSYYKAALAPKIVVHGTVLSEAEAAFLSETYRLGLGQLCYENKLSLDRVAAFPHEADAKPEPVAMGEGGDLVALGGGKDSLVSAEILRAAALDFVTFSAPYSPEAATALEELAQMVGQPYLPVKRVFDPQLLELNRQGAYNGHVPVTAIIMLIGLAAAVLSGRRRVVFSNEASAGEGNVEYEGVQINHQYSKSLEFERAMRTYLHEVVSPDVDCFSLLRPLGDLRIGQLFCQGPLDRYDGHFTSCNRSFRHGSQGFTWCGECPKCAFVFLEFAPFVPKDRLVAMFGQNLLDKSELEPTYRELLGLTGHKPFECVGEIEECRQAVRMLVASDNWPEAGKFAVPDEDYDWQLLHESAMPARYRAAVEAYLERAAS